MENCECQPMEKWEKNQMNLNAINTLTFLLKEVTGFSSLSNEVVNKLLNLTKAIEVIE